MKKLFAILSLLIFFSASAFSNSTIPTLDDELIIDSPEVTFTIKNNSSHIISSSFNKNQEVFTIKTESTISFLQVVNAHGEVEYQLPIGGNVLKLSLGDFEKGTFQINLLVEGENRFVTTELVKKT